MMKRLGLVALFLALLPATANETRPVVAVAPFRDGADGALGRRVSGAILAELAQSRYVICREEQEISAVVEQVTRAENSPELFGSTATNARLGQAAAADYIIVGQVGREGDETWVQTRCVRVGEQTVVPGSAFDVRSRDADALAGNIAEAMHVKVTGGYPLGLEREDRLIRNDTSDAQLTVAMDRAAEGGRLPIYLRDELARITVWSSVDGFVSVIAIGKDEVYQLFPVGPVGEMNTAVTAGQPLSLPTAEYARYGYTDPGFQLYGDTPGIEKIHVFFCRQRISTVVPDSQANPNLKQMTPSQYFEEFLPRLKRELASKDRLWNGTSCRYFYGVDSAELEQPPAREDQQTVAAGDPTAALAQDRGPEISVDEVVGMWPIEGGDTAAAKEGALIDARRNALEQALGVMVRSETAVEQYQLVRDQIEVQTQTGFVRVREVTEEAERDGTYVVKINATVTTSPIVGFLRDSAALQQIWAELDHPRIVCLVEDAIDHNNADLIGDADRFAFASARLTRQLTDAGLTVLEPAQVAALEERDQMAQALAGNREAAADLARQLKAELIVLGRARAAVPTVQAGTGPAKTPAYVDLSVVNAADASVLVQASDSAIGYFDADDPKFAGRQAIVKVIDKLFAPAQAEQGLLARLYGRWMSQPTTFTVKVAGETEARLRAFCDSLKPAVVHVQTVSLADPTQVKPNVPSLFHAATLREFTAALATLEIRSPLRPGRGAEELAKRFEQYGWEVTAIDAGTLIECRPAGGAPG